MRGPGVASPSLFTHEDDDLALDSRFANKQMLLVAYNVPSPEFASTKACNSSVSERLIDELIFLSPIDWLRTRYRC